MLVRDGRMNYQTKEIIGVLIDYQFFVIPGLIFLSVLFVRQIWRQVSCSWHYYLSKRKFVEQLEYSHQRDS